MLRENKILRFSLAILLWFGPVVFALLYFGPKHTADTSSILELCILGFVLGVGVLWW